MQKLCNKGSYALWRSLCSRVYNYPNRKRFGSSLQPIAYGLQLIICFSRRLFSCMVLKNIRILHLGFLCVSLKSLLFKATKNKGVVPYGLLCFMLFNLSTAQAQSSEDGKAAEGQIMIKPLQIGDTIPEELWNMPLQVVNHPEGKDTITLHDYRDKKLIILDFWSSWCGPCVRSLPHINKLHDERSNDFSILLVTRDDPDRITKFERRIKDDYKQQIPYVKNPILESYFPFKSLPQNVWINSRGLVVCIAMGDVITSQNVDILNR